MRGRTPIDALLATYPRSRPPLPGAHRDAYIEHYRANRSGEQGLSRIVVKLESWMHRRLAEEAVTGNLLEIGAGNLNHVCYHPDAAAYDVVEPFRELWQDSPNRTRVRRIYADLAEIPPSERYQAILCIAVLEHLTGLPSVLARAAQLLGPNGNFRAAFPSEGGALWGIAWRLTTALEYRLKRGLSYGDLMRHEHVNTAAEILALLGYLYEKLEIARFPLPWGHLSFYTAVIARRPRLDSCRSLSTESVERGICL